MSLPRLKSVSVVREGTSLFVYRRAHERLELSDPAGSVAELLRLLAEGADGIPALRRDLARAGHTVTAEQVHDCLDHLEGLGLLQAFAPATHPEDSGDGRHDSNLAYYELFATRSRSAADIHAAVVRSRVLLLGVGGAGSGVLQALVGAGVPWLRIVDPDVVEPRNLARQFCYSHSDLGRPKVEAAADWVAAYSPGTTVEPVATRVASAGDVRELADGADVIVCAIDSPAHAQLMVNEACMHLGIPFVTGGLQQSTLFYWSVEPGASPCRMCLELHREERRAVDPALADPLILASRVNRGTGPVVEILSGFMAMETLRYLSRHDPPAAAGRYQWLSLADGMRTGTDAWDFHPACPHCSGGERGSHVRGSRAS